MMDNFISQAELDSLLRKNGELNGKEETLMMPEDLDILSEVGNVTLSAASDALSKFLKQKVTISAPTVEALTFEAMAARFATPMAVAAMQIKGDVIGDTLIALEPEAAAAIASIVSGGDPVGDWAASEALAGLSTATLAALTEGVNYTAGYLFEALSEMTGLTVEPFTAETSIWEGDAGKRLAKHFMEKPVCVMTATIGINGQALGALWHLYAGAHAEAIVAGLHKKYNPEASEEDLSTNAVPVPERLPMVEEKPQPAVAPTKTSAAPFTASQATSAPLPEVEVQKPMFAPIKESSKAPQQKNLDLIMDVPLELSVVLGKTKKTIKDVLSLGTGSVVELNKLADEPLEIHVNGKLVAQGEVVVIGENFGIRITQILSREQRVDSLK
ncbi:flagellar motor switch phosphatase FliY [Acidaminobacter hydrogenoformans]|uniref:Flagellar motor switch protein FliN/FliY n=1 Tax=Acidaminobacter hydrogenoformans DSM 2784 TaxID=1120920 RepID=A0A1G5RUX5_9FIRM|nr:flagellar motor switch phosphatase FliY [Acidaminobacter hydrogenoformans]SCZ77853.1 flagellar motor switch protein FliN/FliY [Acidaminobacter hydrogenoformans DSM 2784]